jgi:hypothetical protein
MSEPGFRRILGIRRKLRRRITSVRVRQFKAAEPGENVVENE